MSIHDKFSTQIFHTIDSVNELEWREVVQGRNVYLTFAYLKALESTMDEKLSFFYCLAYNEKKEPVMVSVFQVVKFTIKGTKHDVPLLSKWCIYKSDEGFSLSILVGGNVFANGENAGLWKENISKEEALKLQLYFAKSNKKKTKVQRKISVVLFKEFWPESDDFQPLFRKEKFQSFQIDVNMVLEMSPEWKTMDDYLNQMKTKFRTKAKASFKRSEALEIRDFSAEDIAQHQDQIDLLFTNVLVRSEYSLGAIEPLTFGAFKKNLGLEFTFKAFFYNEIMVGFNTSFENGNVLEANYVGIDYKYNQEHAVYQRMLYNYVEQAIALGIKELHFGRTSELIKSSLGAVPVPMTLYAKHKMYVHNLLFSKALSKVKPSEFELRKPFKTN